MKNYVIILCLFFFANFCCACVCSDTGTKEQTIQKTDAILKGKIISKEIFSKDDHKRTGLRVPYVKYTVVILETIKGKLKTKSLIIATAPGGGGDCGYMFEIGKTYLIYALKHRGNKNDKFLYTSICTRTDKFNALEFNKVKIYCKHKGFS